MRKERDALGEIALPKEALYGIHAMRAAKNFESHHPFHLEWYQAMGLVKQVCYETIEKMRGEVVARYGESKLPFCWLDASASAALIAAAKEVARGAHFEHFIVPGISGGAGTSINMNVNEIIANRALVMIGGMPGSYGIIDPVEHANLFQSTNDVVPTALRIAVMTLLDTLEAAVNRLRMGFERLESGYRDVLRVAYTQMQKAVPSSFGKLFSTYQEALSRDWWRISKCFERIKVVNLGGSAVGTGITVPKYFIFAVTEALRQATGKPVTRGDNLPDATCNLDPIVEVHGILKAHAVNLEKIASDLRLLSSDLFDERSVAIPKRQVGSSIMPGKINPVIPEFVISVAHEVYASDGLITSLCAQGCLDLNAYLPSIGHHLIGSLKHLITANDTLQDHLVSGVTVDAEQATKSLFSSPVIATSLLPFLGYHKAEQLAGHMQRHHVDLFEANEVLKLMNTEKLKALMTPAFLTKLGYKMSDLMDSEGGDA